MQVIMAYCVCSIVVCGQLYVAVVEVLLKISDSISDVKVKKIWHRIIILLETALNKLR